MNKIEVKTDVYGELNPIHMEFLNGGKITIPGEYGGYVIASGCGSGKTTIIKELIRTQRYKGILYSASTIKECNEMYEYCKNLYVSEGHEDQLTNDVIVLHSDYRSEGTDNNLWRNNPKEIMTKPIIICTHHKLLNEFPELLIGYRRNIVNIEYLDYIERANLIASSDGQYYYPRQLILIDELPTCNSLKLKIDKSVIKMLGNRRYHLEYGPNGETWSIPEDPIVYDRPRFDRMVKMYNTELTSSLKFYNSDDSLSDYKRKMILSLIYRSYESLLNEDRDEITIVYNASSLVKSHVNSRYIIFDGTGDLTLYNSEGFRLLTFDKKYSSSISLTKIEYNLKRYQKPNSNEDEIKEELEKNIIKLKEIIDNNPDGTLIVTWKNLKEDNYKVTKGTLNITNNLLNEEFSLTEFYRKRLIQMGVTNPFEIIHYMSGLDKATNEFRNFSSIVFLGEFHVPNYVVSEFNCEYSCNTNSENYLTYQLIQAVCRTRIRNHKGESISIYYTEDWDERSINNLISYISSNKVIKKDTSLDFIKPKWRNQCKKLIEISEEFRRMIEIKEGGKVTFTLDEIYNIIPLNEKKVKSYYPLINYFRKLGIEITIESNDTRFTSIYNPKT